VEGIPVPKKLYYRIGEACRAVDIQPYVLRYWETEFDALAPGKSKSGQRVYTEEELGVIRRIKELLYEEGYTIAGAKKRLQAELEDGRSFAPPEGELFTPEEGGGESGGDEVPVIAVETSDTAAAEDTDAPTRRPDEVASEGDEEALTLGPEARIESRFTEPPAAIEEPEDDVAAPEMAEAASEDAPASVEVEERVEKPRARAAGARASASRRRAASTAHAAAAAEAPVGSTTTGSATEDATAQRGAGLAPARTAVDSALSERVETLEHGLRRVLAEVRVLRELLGGSSADR
jgi:DNA-binding transcriptional MerR regulator